MSKIMDWILAQIRLVDIEEEQGTPEQDEVLAEKSWLELFHIKKG